MPAFSHLPARDVAAVIEHVKTFCPERWEDPEDVRERVLVPEPPAQLDSPARIRRGRLVYAMLGCSSCHGHYGRGDGPLAKDMEDAWGNRITPFDFTQGALKMGAGAEAIYRTFHTGLNGTPMPDYSDAAAVVDGDWILEKAVEQGVLLEEELEGYADAIAQLPSEEELEPMLKDEEQTKRLTVERSWELVAYTLSLRRPGPGPTTAPITAYLALLAGGLAMSLHCACLCGPLLLAHTGTARLCSSASYCARKRAALDQIAYQAGRLCSYSLLGLAAGFAGHFVREGSTYLGWAHAGALVIGAITIVAGVILLRMAPASTESAATLYRIPVLRGLAASLVKIPGTMPRLLLGMLMGLIPCGAVYTMLAIVASFGHPLASALGMLVFGLGTLPSLSVVALMSARVPLPWRRHAMRVAGAFVITSGAWVIARAELHRGHRCYTQVAPIRFDVCKFRGGGTRAASEREPESEDTEALPRRIP